MKWTEISFDPGKEQAEHWRVQRLPTSSCARSRCTHTHRRFFLGRHMGPPASTLENTKEYEITL